MPLPSPLLSKFVVLPFGSFFIDDTIRRHIFLGNAEISGSSRPRNCKSGFRMRKKPLEHNFVKDFEGWGLCHWAVSSAPEIDLIGAEAVRFSILPDMRQGIYRYGR